MPSVKHVAKARQRYEMVPVLDADGKQVIQTTARKTRTGREVTKKLTKPDPSKPLPPFSCDYCRQAIPIGTGFKYIDIKRQHGGITYRRHESCPNWQPWEYSTALWARIAQIQDMRVDVSEADPADNPDPEDLASDTVEAIRELAAEKQESFDNMPEGLQQGDTGQQLEEAASALEEWAEQPASIDLPELEQEDEECAECEGTGELGEGDKAKECPQCGGEGTLEAEELTAEQADAWREEVRDAIQAALDDAPEVG